MSWHKAFLRRISGRAIPRCVLCGSTYKLEIDHVQPRTWEINGISETQRRAHYERDLREGVELRVACRACNSKRGGQYSQQLRKLRRNFYDQKFNRNENSNTKNKNSSSAERLSGGIWSGYSEQDSRGAVCIYTPRREKEGWLND